MIMRADCGLHPQTGEAEPGGVALGARTWAEGDLESHGFPGPAHRAPSGARNRPCQGLKVGGGGLMAMSVPACARPMGQSDLG